MKFFKVNEGPTDRIIRIAVGIIALSVAAGATGPLFFVALAVGLVGLVTGVTGFCLPYVLLGIDTLPKKSRDSQQYGGA